MYLDKVPVSLEGLHPEVIACAETQERFCWMCHPSLTEHIIKHYNETWDLPSVATGARAAVIGKVTEGGIYRLHHQGAIVCEAKSTDITLGLQYTRPTNLVLQKRSNPVMSCDGSTVTVQKSDGSSSAHSIEEIFTTLLKHPNHASKAPAIKHFDKDVIGNSIIEAGEADASVIAPLRDMQSYLPSESDPGFTVSPEEQWIGAVFAGDGNHRYGKISPYYQGLHAALESMANVIATGGTPRALTDCLNYGNPEIPEHLAALEEGVRGISDAAKGIRFDGECVPVISGNVSLYNSIPDGSAIPPSAIVSCMGVISDARKAVTMQAKKSDSALLLLGERQEAAAGSAYFEVLEKIASEQRDTYLGSSLPILDLEALSRLYNGLRSCFKGGLIHSCHDISDGGLLLALFEMLLPQRKIRHVRGMKIDLASLENTSRPDFLLFSESPGFVIEVAKDNVDAVGEIFKKNQIPFWTIGTTLDEPTFTIRNGSVVLLDHSTDDLLRVWEKGLEDALQGKID